MEEIMTLNRLETVEMAFAKCKKSSNMDVVSGGIWSN